MFTILNDYLIINIPLIANSKLISTYKLGSEDDNFLFHFATRLLSLVNRRDQQQELLKQKRQLKLLEFIDEVINNLYSNKVEILLQFCSIFD